MFFLQRTTDTLSTEIKAKITEKMQSVCVNEDEIEALTFNGKKGL